jgi:hypothetical protein
VAVSKAGKLEWVVRRRPKMPEFRTERDLMRLPKKELVADQWAASVNADEAMYMASEWAARAAELADMLAGKRPVDRKLVAATRRHRRHVVTCKRGSCEHEYAALVRAGLETA